MKVLVTGASGLLGHELAHRLCAGGDEVRVLLRKSAEQAGLFSGTDIECMQGSLEDIDSLKRAVEGVDEVYHCAATSTDWATWDEYYSGNVDGVRNLLAATSEVAPNLKRFLHVSSTDVYGYPKQVVDESADLVETHVPYNKTKIMGEQLVWKAHAEGMPVTVARPATIYGPRDNDFVADLYHMLEKGQWEMPLISGGRSSPGLIFISNAADGMIGAARSGNTIGKAYNLRDESVETWREYLVELAEQSGFKPTKLQLPFWFAYTMAATLEKAHRLFGNKSRPLLTRHAVYLLSRDASFPIERAKKDFGFTSAVSFKDGVAASVAWMKSNNEK